MEYDTSIVTNNEKYSYRKSHNLHASSHSWGGRTWEVSYELEKTEPKKLDADGEEIIDAKITSFETAVYEAKEAAKAAADEVDKQMKIHDEKERKLRAEH